MGARLARLTRSGATGWALLAAGVIAWNATHTREGEMLSEAFERALGRRRTATVVTAVWLVLTLHLFKRIPAKLDPFAWMGAGLSRLAGGKA